MTWFRKKENDSVNLDISSVHRCCAGFVGEMLRLWQVKLNPDATSFPQNRESTPSSVIPAKAGIHPIIRHSRGNPIIRHSREGGNPQFPRTREFNEKKHHPD